MPPPGDLVYLGLGSNLGRRAHVLARAAMRLALLPGLDLLRLSPVYETAPWGVTAQPAFLNLVLAARVTLAPFELLAEAKRLEAVLGREPAPRWGPRAIDIDILLLGNRHIDTPRLTIPHRELTRRQFVLVPLSAIAPDALLAPNTTASMLAVPDDPGVTCLGSLAEVVRRERAEMPTTPPCRR